jgi:hypothetical protein
MLEKTNCLVKLMFGLSIALMSMQTVADNDISGLWGYIRNEDILRNPHPGDFGGIPISEAGLLRATTWDATIQKMNIWQCRPHPIGYWARSPHDLMIQREVDPDTRAVIAFHLQMQESTVATIWMDGRPHPSENSLHSWNGFSTGSWINDGSVLKVRTTHLKESYLRRNGVVYSDQTEMTQFFMRRDDQLSWVQIFHDPNYLSEPFVRVSEFRNDSSLSFGSDPCVVADELPVGTRNSTPHYLPGEHPFLDLHSIDFECPYEACLGGADTMYPEYREVLRSNGGLRVPSGEFPESGPGGR